VLYCLDFAPSSFCEHVNFIIFDGSSTKSYNHEKKHGQKSQNKNVTTEISWIMNTKKKFNRNMKGQTKMIWLLTVIHLRCYTNIFHFKRRRRPLTSEFYNERMINETVKNYELGL